MNNQLLLELISKEIRRAEGVDMNIHSPPPIKRSSFAPVRKVTGPSLKLYNVCYF